MLRCMGMLKIASVVVISLLILISYCFYWIKIWLNMCIKPKDSYNWLKNALKTSWLETIRNRSSPLSAILDSFDNKSIFFLNKDNYYRFFLFYFCIQEKRCLHISNKACKEWSCVIYCGKWYKIKIYVSILSKIDKFKWLKTISKNILNIILLIKSKQRYIWCLFSI